MFPISLSYQTFPSVLNDIYFNIIAQCSNYSFPGRRTPPMQVSFPSPTDGHQNSPPSGIADWMTMVILVIFLLFFLVGIILCIALKKCRVSGSRCPFCNWPSLSARKPTRVYVWIFAQWSDTRLLFENHLWKICFLCI